MLRLNGMAIDGDRQDIRATTDNYSDQSPFFYFGETAIALIFGKWIVGAGISPHAYDKQKNAFIDTTVGQAPVARTNQLRSSVDRLSVSAARSLGEFSLAASLEGYLVSEKYSATPSPEAQEPPISAIPSAIDLQGTTLGGALGADYRALPWLAVGAVARTAGSVDLKDSDGNVVGKDEIPFSFELGARVGKGRGGNLYLDARYQAQREAALGDSVGRGAEVAPARWDLAASYAYLPAQASWEFRAGFGWSPRPTDGGAALTRFGIGVGYDLSDLIARAAFTLEERKEEDGAESSRRILLLGLDIPL
jgi:hypothetical protein